MTLYPEIQAKARSELDQVLGSSPQRLPDFSDQPSLPYIGAIVRETLRWNPVMPLGTCRAVSPCRRLDVVFGLVDGAVNRCPAYAYRG